MPSCPTALTQREPGPRPRLSFTRRREPALLMIIYHTCARLARRVPDAHPTPSRRLRLSMTCAIVQIASRAIQGKRKEQNEHTAEDLVQTIRQLAPAEKEQVIASVLQLLRAETEVKDLADLKTRYPDEWLAILIPEGEDRYSPRRGRLIAHSPDRSFVWQQVNSLPASEDIYVFLNGPVATKGFGITFHDTTDTPLVATVGG